jgi:hypothetical protein
MGVVSLRWAPVAVFAAFGSGLQLFDANHVQ